MRNREAEHHAQGHTASNRQRQDLQQAVWLPQSRGPQLHTSLALEAWTHQQLWHRQLPVPFHDSARDLLVLVVPSPLFSKADLA